MNNHPEFQVILLAEVKKTHFFRRALDGALAVLHPVVCGSFGGHMLRPATTNLVLGANAADVSQAVPLGNYTGLNVNVEPLVKSPPQPTEGIDPWSPV